MNDVRSRHRRTRRRDETYGFDGEKTIIFEFEVLYSLLESIENLQGEMNDEILDGIEGGA